MIRGHYSIILSSTGYSHDSLTACCCGNKSIAMSAVILDKYLSMMMKRWQGPEATRMGKGGGLCLGADGTWVGEEWGLAPDILGWNPTSAFWASSARLDRLFIFSNLQLLICKVRVIRAASLDPVRTSVEMHEERGRSGFSVRNGSWVHYSPLALVWVSVCAQVGLGCFCQAKWSSTRKWLDFRDAF